MLMKSAYYSPTGSRNIHMFSIKIKPKDVDYYRDLITFVADRAGHDKRYGINSSKITTDLGWYPQETLESGLRKTVVWYL